MKKKVKRRTSKTEGIGFENIDEALRAWKDVNKPLCKDREWGAFVCEKVDAAIQKKIYITGRTYKGTRNNVILGFVAGYICGAFFKNAKLAGFIHTHPEPKPGRHNDFPSKTDLFLLNLPGMHEIYVVPWKRCPGIPEMIKASDRRSWDHQ